MKKLVKPHFHVLQSDNQVVAMVMTWAYAGRNVVLPMFFMVEGDYPAAIGEWIRPIMEDLFDDYRPLYLRDKHGHEFRIDKSESELSFFFE
jgi:hypothetical protein